MRKMFGAVIMLVALVAAGVVTGAPAGADTVSDEHAFVARINDLRASKGLGTLTVNGELVDIARGWAGQMAAAGAISHNPSFAGQVDSDWEKLGENVGVGGSVDSLMTAFINSPGHYANLVDPAFTHVGVGVVRGGDGRIYTSHQFMKLRSSSTTTPKPTVTAAPKPKPVATTAAPKPATTRPAASAPRTTVKPAAPASPKAPPAPTPVPLRISMSLEQLSGLGPS